MFSEHCLLEFGEYVYNNKDREKPRESRMLKALVLYSTRNIQGGHFCLNIHTGRAINCFTWTALLLPTCIHTLVWRLARISPIALEVLDGLQLEVTGANPDKEKSDEDYTPGEVTTTTMILMMATEANITTLTIMLTPMKMMTHTSYQAATRNIILSTQGYNY